MKQFAIPFHNTTNEKGATLNKYVQKARTQDDDVLAYFKANPENDLITPDKVLCYLEQVNPRQYEHANMITSIRRSFNTLLNSGKIEKLENKIMGAAGRKVHCWRLSK